MRFFSSLLIAFCALATTSLRAQFMPEDLDTLVFFVQSIDIDTNLHVAHCADSFCFNHPNTEQAPIDEQYCDITACPDGCVRRWIDRSDYVPANGFNPPEYTHGRNFGQDDHEKPCYIPDCLNGQPCVRGGAPYGVFYQDKTIENQVSDIMTLDNAFSIFLLCKPIDQTATGNWYYFGQAHSNLQHKVSNNSLQFHMNGPSPVVQISPDNSVHLNEWQLIEIHRSADDTVTCVINGVDVTNVIHVNGTNFRLGYLFSNFKTQGDLGMYGDVASMIVYEGALTEDNKDSVRTYLDNIYNYSGIAGLETGVLEAGTVGISPNPFKEVVNVHFSLQKNVPVTVSVTDLSGRVIMTLEERIVQAGFSDLPVNLAGVTSTNGIYLIHVKAGNDVYTERILKL